MAYQQDTNHYDKGEPKKDNSVRNILIVFFLAILGIVVLFSVFLYNIHKEQVEEQTKRRENLEKAASMLREMDEKKKQEKNIFIDEPDASERVTINVSDLKPSTSDSGSSNDDSTPYVMVDQMPSFPGGEVAMQKFIANNLKYPVSAQEEGLQGRVILRFVVERDGSIDQIQVIRGIGRDCDLEAMRVVKTMPKWIPGKHNGRVVPITFALPIIFRLK